MEPGQFICIVGPSGSGKDTLIDGIRDQVPADAFVFAQRTITRAPGKPGEIYESVTEAEFAEREAQDAFLITWQAHGLHYALPKKLLDAQRQGKHIIANGSRAIAETLQTIVPNLTFIEITAPLEILAQRILLRGRETLPEIERRLKRAEAGLPASISKITVHNDLTKEIGVTRFMCAVRNLCQLEPLTLAPIDRYILALKLNANELQTALEKAFNKTLPDELIEAINVQQLQTEQTDDFKSMTTAYFKLISDRIPCKSTSPDIVLGFESMGQSNAEQLKRDVYQQLQARTESWTNPQVHVATFDAKDKTESHELWSEFVKTLLKTAKSHNLSATNWLLMHTLCVNRLNGVTHLGLEIQSTEGTDSQVEQVTEGTNNLAHIAAQSIGLKLMAWTSSPRPIKAPNGSSVAAEYAQSMLNTFFSDKTSDQA